MDESSNLRRPLIVRRELLDERQQEVYDAIMAGPRGVVEGPLRVWLLSPELADRAQSLGAFCRYQTRLPAVLSELAILVTGSVWAAGFEWHVHAPIALAAGLAPEVIEAIRRGQAPVLIGVEMAVYRFCRELLIEHTVSDDTYASVVGALGREAAVELVGVLGYYGLISMTIKAFNVPVPEGVSLPFGSQKDSLNPSQQGGAP
jgi:4-carboxymuconolactone decarboxylase